MAYVEKPQETAETGTKDLKVMPSLGIIGSFDDAPGPLQMAAVHQVLVLYYGTDNWLEERNKQMPGFYGCIRTTE